MEVVIKVITLDIFATVAIDIWATFSNKVLNFPRTNWAMVGRWLGHIPTGKYMHNPVNSSPEIKYENTIGWVFHYFIGVAYAAIYGVLVIWVLEGSATLFSSWVFGLFTILSPWLILQPALGLGICAVKAPKPNMVRLQNFTIHSIFGIALYCGWQGINA